jgi:hypothetical protein
MRELDIASSFWFVHELHLVFDRPALRGGM